VRLYPSLPGALRRTVALDAALVLLLLLFAWLGFKVHDAVAELNSLSRGVVDAGTQTQDTLRQAGDAVGAVPIVGGQLSESLEGAAQDTGGAVVAAGRESEERVSALADLLGVLTWLVPSLIVLALMLPDRVRQVRRLTAGAKVLEAGGALSTERRRLIAQRAAFGLPFGALLAHTADPLGDLEAGRYDALVAAELEAAGLRPR
jgi:hypothetical protein